MRLRDVVEDDEIALYADPVAAEQMRLVGLPDPSQFRDAYHLVLETNIPDVLGHRNRILRRSCALKSRRSEHRCPRRPNPRACRRRRASDIHIEPRPKSAAPLDRWASREPAAIRQAFVSGRVSTQRMANLDIAERRLQWRVQISS